MIKALFFDLDGTLLGSDRRISARTRATLAACGDRGIRRFIATARPPLLSRMLGWDAQTHALFDGGVYYNGGCVQRGQDKRYTPVDRAVVRQAVDAVRGQGGPNLALQLVGEAHAFYRPLSAGARQGWGLAAGEALTLEAAAAMDTVKLLVFEKNLIDADAPVDAALLARLEALCAGRAQLYVTDAGRCVQIMGQGVSKRQGVERIRMACGLAPEEIAVFGDDVNDVEMLAAYPHSFAMGNADPRARAAARQATLTNDEDGVHHAIVRLLGPV